MKRLLLCVLLASACADDPADGAIPAGLDVSEIGRDALPPNPAAPDAERRDGEKPTQPDGGVLSDEGVIVPPSDVGPPPISDATTPDHGLPPEHDGGTITPDEGQPTPDAGPPPCKPQCDGKACGPNGCGGVCGLCDADAECIGGACELPCAPACTGKVCGPDGCGSTCGGCGPGALCSGGACVDICVPECGDKACGDNGCGGVCGVCDGSQSCNAGVCVGSGSCKEVIDCVLACPSDYVSCFNECISKASQDAAGQAKQLVSCLTEACGATPSSACFAQQAVTTCGKAFTECVGGCTPSCEGAVCGPDGCGGTCGECSGSAACVDGQCQAICIPSCGDAACGGDGCGGVCGLCGDTALCTDGICVPICQPACQAKSCGTDGCGGSCGACEDKAQCSDGACVPICTPACAGKTCGGDGCGGSCGACESGESCQGGSCVPNCVPSCTNKTCGDDGCGGTCGACETGQLCKQGQCYDNCKPNCWGKSCGGDGCGGSCGTCAPGDTCNSVSQCEKDCVDCCKTDSDCDDGNSCTSDICDIEGECHSLPKPPNPFIEEVCGDGIDNDCDPSTVCYELKQGGKTTPITPVQGTQGVVNFYSYKFVHDFSADTGYEVEDKAALLLYRDGGGNVSLIFILDEVAEQENIPDGGQFDMTLSGAMGMEILVYDDIPNQGGNDIWDFDTPSGEGYFHWWWSGCCTDGFALGYLQGTFCLDIDPHSYAGTKAIAFWATPAGPTDMSTETPFSICSVL